MSSYSRQQLEAWLKTINVKGKVLGVGDSQNPTKGRTKTWETDEYKILDLPFPHEIKQQPDIMCDMNYRITMDSAMGYFDIAFATEIFEYIWNPLQALQNINYLLKKGGILYISFHFIYEIHPPIGLDYLRYTPDGAIRLLEEAGFIIGDMQIRDFAFPENAQRLYNGEGMRGIKDKHNIQGCLIKAIKI